MAADILNACVVSFDGDFNWQVQNILESVRLTRWEVRDLRRLFCDLEETLQTFWPGCTVMPFGSIVTGLGIKTSDADCFVSVPECLKGPGAECVMTAKRLLRRRSHIFQQLFAITAAKVPIVKFFHAPTQCHCDVSFKSPSGVRNSRLIAFLLQLDERALPFAVLIKYWSKVHKLTGTNLVPNYALTMMTIFYLQQVNIIPSVLKLQQGVPRDMVDNWNTAFNEYYQHQSTNDKSLYTLLGGFFEYYSTYKYSVNVISPYTGYSVNLNLFKDFHQIPDEFSLYKENIKHQRCKTLQIKCTMCVQDPFEHSRNGSMAVHPKLFTRLLCHLRDAADKFKHSSQDEFLRAILDPSNSPEKPMYTTHTQPHINRPRHIVTIPNRPNRVTKPKDRNRIKKNMTLQTLYNEANRITQNMRQK